MKYYRKTVLVAVLAIIPLTVDAICSPSNETCQPASGSCTQAVNTALGGDLGAAFDVLSYGKYCGGTGGCVGSPDPVDQNNSKVCQIGGPNLPCPAAPCDGVDNGCMEQRNCFMDRGLTFPDYCICDVDFIASMAFLSQTTNVTGLCDSEFYSQDIPGTTASPVELLGHEATLMATPFCCELSRCKVDAQNNGYQSTFDVANLFCGTVLDGLKQLGIDLCAVPSSQPSMSNPLIQKSGKADKAGKGKKKSTKIGKKLHNNSGKKSKMYGPL
mmetsp:Transcript_39888/g.58603  ORF Transcript_39888/g.58603 Transcript_39888/m.58603 type:complete len:271 (+) Transcript_39888:64-876(+)|eukprot:CAMPEP_0195524628 /NCGR_PEP_ID=MMETSP0794_2-20130614/24550_1 /TAXON_ID=515487 /ORGANISM="Stephanopyxis turris, Strain CCMP 815" /LENGTH=270 /DNA_ID=CAMNT_0040654883 /DNA_START=56 /DNA_END=868 /DNA_ORIENTATION=+